MPVMNFCLSSETRTRGHGHKLYKERWESAVRGQFFSYRVVNLWNSLPESVTTSKDVITFKISLDKHWETKPWLYDFENDT